MRLRTPSPPPDLASAARVTPADPPDLEGARRRATATSRLRRAGILAAVVAAVMLVTWLVGYSTLLAAEDVVVEGADGSLAEQVLGAAAVPLGAPLARVDTGAVAERVESVPEVAAASVSRGWPDTVVVTVTPRQPLASMASDGVWRLVDGDGVLFSEVADPAEGLPVLVASDSPDDLEARAAGASVASALPADVLAAVERIEAGSSVEVRLVLRDGRLVVWGSADDPERKAEVLTTLLSTPATEYDVSVPDRPTLRPVA